jgi:hypothetical protein
MGADGLEGVDNLFIPHRFVRAGDEDEIVE